MPLKDISRQTYNEVITEARVEFGGRLAEEWFGQKKSLRDIAREYEISHTQVATLIDMYLATPEGKKKWGDRL